MLSEHAEEVQPIQTSQPTDDDAPSAPASPASKRQKLIDQLAQEEHDPQSQLKAEIQAYMAMVVTQEQKKNPLLFWKANSSAFPH
jgi:hypothetical protein